MILIYYLLGAATVTAITVMMIMVYRYAFQKGWDIRDAIVTGNKEYFNKKPEDYVEPPEFALLNKQEKKPEIEDDNEEDEE